MVRFFKIPSWQVQQGELVPGEANVGLANLNSENEESGEYRENPHDGEAIEFSYKGKTYAGVVVGGIEFVES